jgi:hypothetical protein
MELVFEPLQLCTSFFHRPNQATGYIMAASSLNDYLTRSVSGVDLGNAIASIFFL